MAPGLSGRQTGTVPKNKAKSSESQSHRLPREQHYQVASAKWEHMSDLGNRKVMCNRSSAQSENQVDSHSCDLGRSRTSTITSQNENMEDCRQNIFGNKLKALDRKQVVSKLTQIQNYLQQTADLMSSIKSSDSWPQQKSQYDKLAAMLEDLKDSEEKLITLLHKMDSSEAKIDSVLTDLDWLQQPIESGDSRRMQKFNRIVNENYGSIMCANTGNGNSESVEEELSRKSEESKKKLEALQKRKQDLLKLQEKAKKQLREAQAEQSRLVARASNLNQELNSSKISDLNVQQLSQRLKAVQQIYSTRNQISECLNDDRRANKDGTVYADDTQCQETSDTETDFQMVADKMEELNAMKAQLNEIQKIMASMNGFQNGDSHSREPNDDTKDFSNHNFQNSMVCDGISQGDESSFNVMKLEQAKSKLNQLTQLLDIVQSNQNPGELSPPYMQMVSNLAKDEAGSTSPSASPAHSDESQKHQDEISIETMQVMTRELEETTAAMKEERDKLEAARQELQNVARRLPLSKQSGECLSPSDCDSEPPCLKATSLESSFRDILNASGSIEGEQSSNCNDSSLTINRATSRSKQQGTWNIPVSASNSSTQERQYKNEPISRGSNQSSRGGSRNLVRDSRWSPSPPIGYCSERSNPAVETQNQLEMSNNLCEMVLSESGVQSGEISLQNMFSQHQLLTRTVAQCSQLLWLQQKQIIELRNALMLHGGACPSLNMQPTLPIRSEVPIINNSPYLGFAQGQVFSNLNPHPSMNQVPIQQHQTGISTNHNAKLNGRDIQNASLRNQEFTDQFLHGSDQAAPLFSMPASLFDYEMRFGNFNRSNPSVSNANQNLNHSINSGSNGRVPNGMNCIGPEDSGALNNQVPPGNRANNYWDNFRSYSRQNLLSNTKSNEDTDTSRRSTSAAGLERPLRDAPPPLQNNQSGNGAPQLPVGAHGNSDSVTSNQYLLPPSQNASVNHHGQITRPRSFEPQGHRNQAKNETRHQDNDSRNYILPSKNEGPAGARARIPDSENLRFRNDVNQSLRNTDNVNSTRNFRQSVREHDNDDVTQGINKKRLERGRCRKEGPGGLNNRTYCNSSLWENISSEVSSFIRTNETRPHFLIQLFRDLQQITNDNLRQRALESIQETVNANNLSERTFHSNGGNVNLIENRNNIRENHSNLNRNQSEDPCRIDELFYQLRENQNTIRQNIGMSSFLLGGGSNLENPNISNIRDFINLRNNIENEGLRDLRTYFEANLCNFGGHHSTLENPNVSNIRENLTRRVPSISGYENVNPKNVYLNMYENAVVESRRRNQEGPSDAGPTFRNFELDDAYPDDYPVNDNNEASRSRNNQYELGNSFEGAVGGRGHYRQDNGSSNSRFPLLEGGDNFGNSRQLLANGNDSGIDINFNNEERKRSYTEEENVIGDGNGKAKKNDAGDIEGAVSLIMPQWERSGERSNSFESSPLNHSRNEMGSSFMQMRENSFFNCRGFQQSDNGDLAEADQSRNEETSGAESDSGFINPQIPEPENGFGPSQSHQSLDSNFSSQNIPESERNLEESQNLEANDMDNAGANAENASFPNPASEPEANFPRTSDTPESLRTNETSEIIYYQLNAGPSSENCMLKSGVKYRKRGEEAERVSSEPKKGTGKNSTNKSRDNSFKKFNEQGVGEYDNQDAATPSLSVISFVDECQQTESRESVCSEAFPFALDKGNEGDKGVTSPEAESDWECGSGLDQVPTRLKKSGSSRKSDDSSGSLY